MEDNASPDGATPAINIDRRRITREMVQARTRELALIAGRSPLDISHGDYEQAKRELTGESDIARQDAMLG